MGFNVENNNPKQLADRLAFLINDKQTRLEMGCNSRKCFEDLFDRNKTYQEIVDILVS